jgi:NADH:ubiquinone oxidoreductase subunit 6 (subunit J)
VLFLLASLSLLLGGSTYLGLTYIVVYVGAISLLFVFTVMMVGGGLQSS